MLASLALLNSKLNALRAVYFMAGTGMSAWAIIVPYSKIRFHLSDGVLGLILLSAGTGGMLAMPFCGPLIARFGSRAVLIAAGVIFGLTLPLLTFAPTPAALAALLFVFGFTFGGVDVAMNAQAVVLEARSGRLQMSSFHALFSIGGLAIALAASLALGLGMSHGAFAIASGALIVLLLGQARKLVPRAEDLPSDGPALVWPNRATFILGMACFACFLTEGAMTDWSTIFLRFSRGMSLATAALGYAAFSVAMAATRLAGDAVATRLGQARLMRLGCGLAIVGLAIAVLIPSGAAGIGGFFLVGLGVGNIAPLVFSAAGRVPGMSAHLAMPAIVSLGYFGFLIGPVIIGLIAQRLGLSTALGMDAALLLAISFAAEAVAV